MNNLTITDYRHFVTGANVEFTGKEKDTMLATIIDEVLADAKVVGCSFPPSHAKVYLSVAYGEPAKEILEAVEGAL